MSVYVAHVAAAQPDHEAVEHAAGVGGPVYETSGRSRTTLP